MEYKIKCKCGRFLGSTTKSTEVTLKCSDSRCKSLETYDIVFMSDYEHTQENPPIKTKKETAQE